MEKKLILGISASPRKDANTDRMLRYALEAAETVEGIEKFMEQQKIENITDIIGCVK